MQVVLGVAGLENHDRFRVRMKVTTPPLHQHLRHESPSSGSASHSNTFQPLLPVRVAVTVAVSPNLNPNPIRIAVTVGIRVSVSVISSSLAERSSATSSFADLVAAASSPPNMIKGKEVLEPLTGPA